MERCTSIYLDFLRFAALTVMLSHFSFPRFSQTDLGYFHQYGHIAVVVFFVISGYVIAYVSDVKERNFASFVSSRFARLYSVLLPALLLIPVLDMVGMVYDKFLYLGYSDNSSSFF